MKTCKIVGCAKLHMAKGLCSGHYQQIRRGGEIKLLNSHTVSNICIFDGCERMANAKGLCRGHWLQDNKGMQLYPLKPRAKNGAGSINKDGYRIVSFQGKQILEHRYVMEKHLNRKLFDFENVHHKNGIRHDNNFENLELWVTSQPSGQRPEDLFKWCEWYRSQFLDSDFDK